jgi:SAM-dependent methyltransferase
MDKNRMRFDRSVSFGDRSTVTAYDELQVPALFRPWATLLSGEFRAWRGRTVLDLATGSGIVAQVLASRVGAEGKIIAADVSGEMLELARRRCAGLEPEVEVVRSSAHPLELPDASIDVVVCQQGFQFFPDRRAAAVEIHRVLRPGGTALIASWTSLADCEYFAAIRDAVAVIGEPALAERMRVPFDFLPADELYDHFARAGFQDVQVVRRELAYELEGGLEQALATARSTVVGQEIEKMPAAKRAEFRDRLLGLLHELSDDGRTVGRTVSNVLRAGKARAE